MLSSGVGEVLVKFCGNVLCVVRVIRPTLGVGRKQAVERALDVADVARADVGVAFGRLHVSVAEQFLNEPNVGTRFEQMRREGVT